MATPASALGQMAPQGPQFGAGLGAPAAPAGPQAAAPMFGNALTDKLQGLKADAFSPQASASAPQFGGGFPAAPQFGEGFPGAAPAGPAAPQAAPAGPGAPMFGAGIPGAAPAAPGAPMFGHAPQAPQFGQKLDSIG